MSEQEVNNAGVQGVSVAFEVKLHDHSGNVNLHKFVIEGRGPPTLDELGAYMCARIDGYVASLSPNGKLVEKLRREADVLRDIAAQGQPSQPPQAQPQGSSSVPVAITNRKK